MSLQIKHQDKDRPIIHYPPTSQYIIKTVSCIESEIYKSEIAKYVDYPSKFRIVTDFSDNIYLTFYPLSRRLLLCFLLSTKKNVMLIAAKIYNCIIYHNILILKIKSIIILILVIIIIHQRLKIKMKNINN